MTTSENIKTIDNRIQKSKSLHKLNRRTAKILSSSSRNIAKYEFLTGGVLAVKGLLEKTPTFKKLNIYYYTVS